MFPRKSIGQGEYQADPLFTDQPKLSTVVAVSVAVQQLQVEMLTSLVYYLLKEAHGRQLHISMSSKI